MAHYFCRLNPPRTTFSADMTPEEFQLMSRHADYWRALLDQGRAELFGLVAEPAGGWGIAVANVESFEAAIELTRGDPVILARCGFRYDILLMPRGAVVRVPGPRTHTDP